MSVAIMQTGINHHGRRHAAMKITSKLNTRKHKVAFVFLHVSLQVLMSQFAISKYYHADYQELVAGTGTWV